MYKDIIAGLQILVKYEKPTAHICAEHDEIFAGPNLTPDKISADDIKALNDAGWTWNPDSDSWHMFV